jgi:hypothetical protein
MATISMKEKSISDNGISVKYDEVSAKSERKWRRKLAEMKKRKLKA